MRGLGRLRRAWERLAILPPAVILAYHRVADLTSDPQLLAVSTRHFEEQLKILRRDYYPLTLRDLRQGLHWQRWRRRSVVVTFDDGYADNLHYAKPRLESADVPATVFVTAGRVDGEREFWWDELESVFLIGGPLPSELVLSLAGKVRNWYLPAEPRAAAGVQAWNVLMREVPPTPRQALYLELAKTLRDMACEERESVLDELFQWAGRTRRARPTHRTLQTTELRDLAAGGLVEVGAHSMTHSVMSRLTLAEQQQEIALSKQSLEDKLGVPVSSLAYPFGGRGDYSPETPCLAKAAGFACACSNFPGHVAFYTDPYQLPRYLVRDWDGDTFARRLEAWFAAS